MQKQSEDILSVFLLELQGEVISHWQEIQKGFLLPTKVMSLMLSSFFRSDYSMLSTT